MICNNKLPNSPSYAEEQLKVSWYLFFIKVQVILAGDLWLVILTDQI